MKRIALLVSIAAALALCATALAGTTLVGKYSTKVTVPLQLKGTWILTFAKGGTYTVADNGQVVVRGRYTATGSTVTMGHETGPAACAKTGKYSWSRSGTTLRLRRATTSAPCTGRDLILAHTFTKVG
jgi:hypothetical protein